MHGESSQKKINTVALFFNSLCIIFIAYLLKIKILIGDYSVQFLDGLKELTKTTHIERHQSVKIQKKNVAELASMQCRQSVLYRLPKFKHRKSLLKLNILFIDSSVVRVSIQLFVFFYL